MFDALSRDMPDELKNILADCLTHIRRHFVDVAMNFPQECLYKQASVRVRRFHDSKNTAITNWFANAMSEYDVMRLAGHAGFTTMHFFYLAEADDLVNNRARAAANAGIS